MKYLIPLEKIPLDELIPLDERGFILKVVLIGIIVLVAIPSKWIRKWFWKD